jgi:hypothetical protein
VNKESQAAHTGVRRIVLLALLYSIPLSWALNSRYTALNLDLWWHLNTGAWIVHHHAVPATDPFSQAGADKPWVAYSWLFDLTLYGFYRGLGLVGTLLYTLTILVGIAIALHRAIRTRLEGFVGPIALAAAGLFAMAPLYSARPWLFSVLFYIVELDIVLAALAEAHLEAHVNVQDDRARRRLWLLPLLFAVWANLHIQFIYGLALLVLAALTQNLDVAIGPQGASAVRTRNRLRPTLWAVTGASFLATLLNPYSWRVYTVILGLAVQHAPYRLVTELTPPTFRFPVEYLIVLIAMAGAFVVGRATLRYKVFAAVLLAGVTVAYLHVARDGWLVVVTALLLIADASRKSAPSVESLPRLQQIAGLAAAMLLIFAMAKAKGVSNAYLEDQVASYYPVKAADVVSQQSLSGPLFNDFNWGGYLMWRLPQFRVSMDGRTNVYGDERIERSTDTWNCLGDWKTDPDLTAANLVIGDAGACLSSALASHPAYQLVYRDPISVVFIRRPLDNNAKLPAGHGGS